MLEKELAELYIAPTCKMKIWQAVEVAGAGHNSVLGQDQGLQQQTMEKLQVRPSKDMAESINGEMDMLGTILSIPKIPMLHSFNL